MLRPRAGGHAVWPPVATFGQSVRPFSCSWTAQRMYHTKFVVFTAQDRGRAGFVSVRPIGRIAFLGITVFCWKRKVAGEWYWQTDLTLGGLSARGAACGCCCCSRFFFFCCQLLRKRIYLDQLAKREASYPDARGWGSDRIAAPFRALPGIDWRRPVLHARCRDPSDRGRPCSEAVNDELNRTVPRELGPCCHIFLSSTPSGFDHSRQPTTWKRTVLSWDGTFPTVPNFHACHGRRAWVVLALAATVGERGNFPCRTGAVTGQEIIGVLGSNSRSMRFEDAMAGNGSTIYHGADDSPG